MGSARSASARPRWRSSARPRPSAAALPAPRPARSQLSPERDVGVEASAGSCSGGGASASSASPPSSVGGALKPKASAVATIFGPPDADAERSEDGVARVGEAGHQRAAAELVVGVRDLAADVAVGALDRELLAELGHAGIEGGAGGDHLEGRARRLGGREGEAGDAEQVAGLRVEHGDAAVGRAKRGDGGLLRLRVDRRLHGLRRHRVAAGEDAAVARCPSRPSGTRQQLAARLARERCVEGQLQAARPGQRPGREAERVELVLPACVEGSPTEPAMASALAPSGEVRAAAGPSASTFPSRVRICARGGARVLRSSTSPLSGLGRRGSAASRPCRSPVSGNSTRPVTCAECAGVDRRREGCGVAAEAASTALTSSVTTWVAVAVDCAFDVLLAEVVERILRLRVGAELAVHRLEVLSLPSGGEASSPRRCRSVRCRPRCRRRTRSARSRSAACCARGSCAGAGSAADGAFWNSSSGGRRGADPSVGPTGPKAVCVR